ncbi:MAG: hypothetical protein GXO66_08885 [Euryarchaeota archaeon]|nr:hypothetical protein [Euryarchaeota archaeon]
MRAGYRLPSRELVLRAARDVLKRHGEVTSLAELHSLVLERLRRQDPRYRLSKARLLRLVALSPRVSVRVEKRRSSHTSRTCPLCGSELQDLYGVNLFGERVKLGRKCNKCGYRIERPDLEPRRYIFFL